MTTKYMVIYIRPKSRANRRVEVVKAGILNSTEADDLKNSLIGKNPGSTAGNFQKITYTDLP